MDITLIRTFLEVSASGSFVHAADRLFVTQSAVSLRIKRLEDQLGQDLFIRSKAGAELTPEGALFTDYALSLVKLWEEARQQIGVPPGFTKAIAIGAQMSLWPRLGFRWIDGMQQRLPHLSIRAEFGMPDRLTRFLVEGIIQAALTYTPQLRPGLAVTKVIDEDLIMVAAWPGADVAQIAARYVMVDWGPEFVQAHAISLPDLKTGTTLALGSLAAQFVVNRALATYLPARTAIPYLATGQLHLVANAPVFPFPVWAIWREDLDPDILDVMRAALDAAGEAADDAQDDVLAGLVEMSQSGKIEVLGGIDERTAQSRSEDT